MRILFLTDNFPPETNAPASRTYEHCKRWVACGQDVTVVTTAPNFPVGKVFEGYRNRLWTREWVNGVEVIRLWSFITANKGFIGRSLDYMSYMVATIIASPFLPKPDVIVSTSPQFFTPCAGYILSRLFGRPWVFELRDLWPDSIVAVGAMKENAVIRTLRKMEYFLYRKATRIVSVTNAFKNVLSGNGITPEKIVVIPNGADIETYWPGSRPHELAARLGLSGKFIAAYVGTIGMAHGLRTLLDAADALRERNDIAFVLVGTGAEARSMAAEAKDRQLSNVHFVGSVTKVEVCEYWKLCNVALVLLRDSMLFSHVIPSKIFEAMSSERPIILGVRGESEALLRDSGAGIVIPPEDSKALAAAIVALADSQSTCGIMGKAGREYVTSHYNRDVLANRMLDVIKETAALHKATL